MLKVLRRERVTVPCGTFDAVVVQPIIHSNGLFGQGGAAEFYFTDDARHLPVLIRSKLPVFGYLNLLLADYVPGRKL